MNFNFSLCLPLLEEKSDRHNKDIYIWYVYIVVVCMWQPVRIWRCGYVIINMYNTVGVILDSDMSLVVISSFDEYRTLGIHFYMLK